MVEAIADGARRRGGAWTPVATRTADAGRGRRAARASGCSALLAGRPGVDRRRPSPALGVAVLLALAGVTASRAYGDGRAGAALGGYAMPYAFAGGALLVASGDPVGAARPLPWLGASELLAGSVALLLVAVLGGVGVAAGAAALHGRRGGRRWSARSRRWPACHLGRRRGGGAVSVLVCGIGALPLLAIRLGKMPTAAGHAADRPTPPRVHRAPARRSTRPASARTGRRSSPR